MPPADAGGALCVYHLAAVGVAADQNRCVLDHNGQAVVLSRQGADKGPLGGLRLLRRRLSGEKTLPGGDGLRGRGGLRRGRAHGGGSGFLLLGERHKRNRRNSNHSHNDNGNDGKPSARLGCLIGDIVLVQEGDHLAGVEGVVVCLHLGSVLHI